MITKNLVFDKPSQALQHNDHGRHGLCGRTLRAAHYRGTPVKLGKE